MARLLRALAALLVLLLAAASVAVADDGWFPADLLCFGSVRFPQRFAGRRVGLALLERERGRAGACSCCAACCTAVLVFY
jgi:hypothetical protein